MTSIDLWPLFQASPASFLASITFIMASVCLFIHTRMAVSCLAISFCSALYAARVTPLGGFILVMIALGMYAAKKINTRGLTSLLIVIGIGLIYLFESHLVPGFNNWQLLDSVTLTEKATPFTLNMNFDVPYFGMLLALFLCPPLTQKTDYLHLIKQCLPILISGSLVACGLAFMFGYVKFEPKFSSFTVIWSIHNLLIVSVIEEIIFREWLQKQTTHVLSFLPGASWLGIFISSLVFGFFHLYGGWTYALLATVMSLHYGYALQKTNRLQGAILIHFGVNLIHFIGFTYPALHA